MDVKSIVDSVVRIAFKGDKGLLVFFCFIVLSWYAFGQ